MIDAVLFYLFAGLMLLAGLSVILNRKPIYSVLSLLVVMFCLAALFIMLDAVFLAALQILLYAGAVLVLFLFVIMLLNLQPEALARTRAFTLLGGGLGAAGVFVWQIVRLLPVEGGALRTGEAAPSGVEALGRLLFTKYLLPFELASFIILAAIVGAVSLAKQEPPARRG